MITLACSPIPDLDPSEWRFSPEKMLSPEEERDLACLIIPKRRREWAAGRILLKKLVQKALPDLAGTPFSHLAVRKEPSGQPYLTLDGVRLPVWVSLSHSSGQVMAACSPHGVQMGVDLERIEPRAEEFISDYFTAEELRFLRSTGEDQDMWATILWSAKEAVLKALALGLRIDTRKIEILPGADENQPQGWNPLEVSLNMEELPALHLNWRREGSMIQTLCWMGDSDPQLTPVSVGRVI